MKIKINENWTIRTDSCNYILCEMGIAEKGKRAGEVVSKHEYFFPTLSRLMDFALEKQILTSDAECWGTVMETVNAFKSSVVSAIKDAGLRDCAVCSC